MTNEQLKQSAKDEAARENGFNDWDDVITYNLSFALSYNRLEALINRAMEIYADKVGQAQWNAAIEKAAEEAEIDFVDYYEPFVDKESILKLKKP